MHLFYGRNLERKPEGATFRNARHFTGPEAGVTEVTVDAEFEAIASAYAALGNVSVSVVGQQAQAPQVVAPPTPAILPLSDAERDATEIPADWADLPWPQLRRLGQAFSAEPVLNKAQATEAVEAELARRAAVAPVVEDEQPAE